MATAREPGRLEVYEELLTGVLAVFDALGKETATLEKLADHLSPSFWRLVDEVAPLMVPEFYAAGRLQRFARLLKHWDFHPPYRRADFVERHAEEFGEGAI